VRTSQIHPEVIKQRPDRVVAHKIRLVAAIVGLVGRASAGTHPARQRGRNRPAMFEHLERLVASRRGRKLAGQARRYAAVGGERHHGRNHGDSVLSRKVGALADVHGQHSATVGLKLADELAAVRAKRVAEGHHQLAVGGSCGAHLGQLDAVEVAGADPAQAGPEPVYLAAHAEAGARRQQRQPGDEQAECGAHRRYADGVGEARGAQHRQADLVGEARRAAVLDRSLADARLDQFEVGDTGHAVAAPEAQADRQLSGEQGQDRHQPLSTATSERVPMVAWLKRGARASMTSRSRYGSAVRTNEADMAGTRVAERMGGDDRPRSVSRDRRKEGPGRRCRGCDARKARRSGERAPPA